MRLPGRPRSGLRFGLLYAAPTMLLLLAAVGPLVGGSETLFLRDVLNTHFGMKAAQARALRAGYLPEIDLYRAGGQPLAGNPNAVPFYPDNLLYLAASPFWAMNAHFWLHLLLAPWTFYWMARAWGLTRWGAWAGGVCFALSGYFLSNLSFYNLVAGVALAPALVAACLAALERRWWAAPAAGGIWTLLLASGDPLLALLAFVLAAGAVVVKAGTAAGNEAGALSPRALLRRVPLAPLALGFTAGTLLAAPQLVEFLRILPLSYRGHKGYTAEVGTVASFDPRQAAEWLLPLLFGRPDRIGTASFWGERFYTGVPPYYFSLYPGLLALALAAASGRPRSAAHRWAWGAAAVGLFFALGRFNPLVGWIFSATGGLLRYPVKLWLPVAVGAALVCGLGFERVFGGTDDGGTDDGGTGGGEGRPAFRRALAALALVLGTVWLLLTLAPGVSRGWLRALIPTEHDDSFVANERLRWAGLALLSLLVLAALAAAFRWLRGRPELAGAAVLAIHAAAQLALLAPLRATDRVEPYTTPPPALAWVPEGSRVVHGAFTRAFGPSTLARGEFPEPRTLWLARRTFTELFPSTGALWNRRYELDVSPEGLDSFVARMAEAAVEHSPDAVRLRLLRVWGVERLLLGRELGAEARGGARLLERLPSYGSSLWIYEIADPAPEVLFAGRVLAAPHMNAAYTLLSDPGFDAATTAVVPGEEEGVKEGEGGTARLLAEAPEELTIEVEARSAGVLVVQRSHLPLWRAAVDGREAHPVAANLYRLGVELEPGRHRVRLWIDRRPLVWSTLPAAAGLLGLVLLGWLGRRPPGAWERDKIKNL